MGVNSLGIRIQQLLLLHRLLGGEQILGAGFVVALLFQIVHFLALVLNDLMTCEA